MVGIFCEVATLKKNIYNLIDYGFPLNDMPYCSGTIQSTPFQHKLTIWKILLLSFITSHAKKRKYLDRITLEARKIAVERGLCFAFFTILSYNHGSTNEVIAQIDWYQSRLNRAIDILFFAHLVMAPEKYIKITIFHEYCHFLWKYAPEPILWDIVTLFRTGRYPHIHNDVEEDFCDLFGYYIVDRDVGDQEINLFIEEFICITCQNIENMKIENMEIKNWMLKVSDMPESYFNFGQELLI